MKRIIKSQLYETVVDKSIGIAALVFACFVGMEWYAEWEYFINTAGEDIYTGTNALNTSMNSHAVMFFVFVITSFICRDYKNKTLYCDILAGYKRKQVFFGRIIPGFVIGVIGTLILTYANVVYYTIVNGWGSDITAVSMLVRIGMFVLLLFRLTGEVALFSVLVKRTTIVYIVSLIIGYVEEQAILFTVVQGDDNIIKYGWMLGGFASSVIVEPGYESVFDETGEIVKSFEQIPPLLTTMASVLSSVLIGGICLYVAYRIFKKQDMN